MMKPGTILLALTGSTAGKTAILNFNACGNQSVVGITPSKILNYKFLYYYMMATRQKILSDCKGSAQPHISKDYVTKMYIVLPPLEEQQRIVEQLDKLLPLCNNL